MRVFGIWTPVDALQHKPGTEAGGHGPEFQHFHPGGSGGARRLRFLRGHGGAGRLPVVAVYWYGCWLARTPAAERPALWRTIFYYAGIALIWIVLQTRYEYMAQHMFFLNRAQHVTMHHLGPFLIALSWPGTTLMEGMPEAARRLTRWRPLRAVVAVIQQPLLAALLFFGLIALW